MRNLKKFLALVLAMMMTLSLMVTVNAATPTDFSDGDKITDAYKEAVDVLSALKVVKGDDRGFRPGETITRAEVSAILYRIVTGDVDDKNAELYKGANYFTDVTADRWYDGYVNYCANNGLVLGVGGGKFNPNAPVTGYEALVMILRAIGFNNPKEFSSGDWRLKASGYGRRYGITNNIAEARLAGPATREMVAEIMFQGLEVPTVKYTVLNDYEKIEFGRNNDESIRYEDLLLRVFGIGGKSLTPVRDNYGKPSVRWYYWVGGGTAITIPVDPVDTFYTAMDECTVVEKLNEGKDINVTNEFLNGRSVERTNTNSKGEIIGTRTLDALHTTNDFVGAQGRKTMVYNYTIEAYGYSNTYWDIVYIDTYLGEVKAKTPATLDTNGHTMHKATLSIEVGAYDGSDADHPYAMLTSDKNFDDYNVGDVLLLNTWSPSAKSATTASVVAENGGNKFTLDLDWTTLAAADALTVARLTTKASARPAMSNIVVGGLPGVGIVITDAADNNVTPVAAAAYTFSYQGSAYPAGTYTVTVDAAVAPATVPTTATITYDSAADGADPIPHATHDFDTDKFEIVDKAKEERVTISGTTGAANDKTGIYVGDKTIMANVVYHMHNHTSTADAVAANNSTPTTAADFYNRIVNEQIGKTYRLWLDGQGNILGMKPATAASVGVVVSMEAVRVSASRYAVEATLFMEDESTITARFLDDTDPANLHQYFATEAAATITKVDKNALLEISSYTKNSQTYYQVEDSDGDYTNAATSGTVVDSDHVTTGSQNVVHTGKSDTLGDPTTIDRVNGDTVFFVAYKDFQYNWGTGNTGGNDDIVWKVIRDFRDIPTITGDGTANQAVVQQTLKPDSNGVAEYAAITCQNFTDGQYDMNGKTPVAVDDSYLIIAPIGTYARYSEYAVMHNGVKETLKVANLNGGVNTNVETALASGQLVTVSGWNMEGAAINVAFVGNSNVVKAATTVSYDNAGVLTLVTGAIQSKAADGNDDTALAADAYMTMAKDVKVMIVNRNRNEVYEGTSGSIAQYASYTGGHAFAWELDANGYISTLYILD